MSFKEVKNIATGRRTYYIDGMKVSRRVFEDKSFDLRGYNSACTWEERGRLYHAFATAASWR